MIDIKLKVIFVAIITFIIVFALGHQLNIQWRITASILVSLIISFIAKRSLDQLQVTGGSLSTCNKVKKYLDEPGLEMKESYCNFEKQDSDKTNLSKLGNRLFHPNNVRNIGCQQDATKAYQQVENACERFIKEKREREDRIDSPSHDPFNNQTEYTSQTSKYVYKSPFDWKKASTAEVKDGMNSGDVDAMREQADRNFANANYARVVTNQSDDMCTIM